MRYMPSFFKQGLVLSTAVAVIVTAAPAQAYSPRNQQPSIEIHLEVLESLRQDALRQQREMSVAPASRVPQAMPFGRPSAPLGQQAQPQVRSAPAAPSAAPQKGYATYQPVEAPKPAPKPVAPAKKSESPKAAAAVPAVKADAKPAAQKTAAKKKTVEKQAVETPAAPKPEKKAAAGSAAPAMKLPAPRELDSLPPLEGATLDPAAPAVLPNLSEMEEDTPALSILDETPQLPDEAQPAAMPEMPALPAAEDEMDSLPPLPPMDAEETMPALPALDEMPADAAEDGMDALSMPPLEDGMPESPALSDAPAPEAEADDGGLVVVPAPLPVAAPAAKEEGGLFSGLKKQISSMLGDEEKTPAPAMDVAAPELPSLPEGAAPLMEDETPTLPALPDMDDAENAARDTVEDALPALPPLPREEVEEVPVSTTPNRSLPSLGAIVSEERRAEMQAVATPALPALPDVKAAAGDTVEQALAELPEPPALPDDSAMMSLDALPELPSLEDMPPSAPSMAEDTLELASLPPLPDAPAVKTAAEKTAVAGTAPEVKEQGKFVRLLYGREDEEIQPAMFGALDGLAQKMKAEPTLKLSMESFAGSDKEQESLAKRISLKRALGVRSYLIDAGIEADRIQPPKVLGSNVQNGPLERIDIRLQ